MEDNWVKVFTTSNAYSAEILKQGLIENEIPAVVLNKQDSSYGTFGVLTVMVNAEDEEKAKVYIEQNEL
ncbi:DUF2007 domain-containing protein [Pedobacter nutrimenti]|uniref:putative signal transducing protein n=1 Tax=Pedobacter nutrimenti TaxID=1241337 RepID=UPI00292F96E3|nr:DUF2007 domain-containing protein [Pedobacter nutrimenti]